MASGFSAKKWDKQNLYLIMPSRDWKGATHEVLNTPILATVDVHLIDLHLSTYCFQALAWVVRGWVLILRVLEG
jgi:hypothetical protein